MNLQILKNRSAKRMGHFLFSKAKLSNSVIMGAQKDYADVLIKSLKDKFRGPIRYQGTMAKGFGRRKISSTSIGVTQSARHEEWIRGGTKGPYKGFPRPVVKWAMVKAKKTKSEAFAIAKSIQAKGTAKTFRSQYPIGKRRFEYPEWAIRENKDALDDLSKELGLAVVRWVTSGTRWKVKYNV